MFQILNSIDFYDYSLYLIPILVFINICISLLLLSNLYPILFIIFLTLFILNSYFLYKLI